MFRWSIEFLLDKAEAVETFPYFWYSFFVLMSHFLLCFEFWKEFITYFNFCLYDYTHAQKCALL